MCLPNRMRYTGLLFLKIWDSIIYNQLGHHRIEMWFLRISALNRLLIVVGTQTVHQIFYKKRLTLNSKVYFILILETGRMICHTLLQWILPQWVLPQWVLVCHQLIDHRLGRRIGVGKSGMKFEVEEWRVCVCPLSFGWNSEIIRGLEKTTFANFIQTIRP